MKDKCRKCGGQFQYIGFMSVLGGKRYKRFYRCRICGHRIERTHKHKLPKGTI